MNEQHPLVLYIGDKPEAIQLHVFFMSSISEPEEALAVLGMNVPDAVIINDPHPMATRVIALLSDVNWSQSHLIVVRPRTLVAHDYITYVKSESEAIERLFSLL